MIAKVTFRGKVKEVKTLLSYATVGQRRRIDRAVKKLAGKKIIHLNATPVGGGVAEMLQSFVPYVRQLGVDLDWYTIQPAAGRPYFTFTNRLHNALQGLPTTWSRHEWETYINVNKKISADLLHRQLDLLVSHDPQPLWALPFLPRSLPAISICHIDTSSSHPATWKRIAPIIRQYRAIVFSNRAFIHQSLPLEKIRLIPPAIDPLAVKQMIHTPIHARTALARFGVPRQGQLIVQISRFDIWKNPLGVIEAFKKIRPMFPRAHLALVGFEEATDNPLADRVFRQVQVAVGTDPRISLWFHPRVIGGKKRIAEVTNLFQNAADVIVQNSTKEGFGLTVTEAMWKGKPVVGGPASGIRLQITHGRNGLITHTPAELAGAIGHILTKPELGRRLGAAAHRSVERNYLMHRYILDHLELYADILNRQQ